MDHLKKGFLCLGMCLFLFLGMSRFAAADTEEQSVGLLSKLDVTVSGTIDYYSKYIWRGFTLDTDSVFQPSLSVSAKGLTFTTWSNWDADNEDSANSDEIDYVIDYTKTFDTLSFSAGHTYYDFPGTNGYSKEFYVGVGLSEVPVLKLPITSSLKFYRDDGDQNHGGGLGNYLELALGYSAVLREKQNIVLDLGMTVGYNHNLFMAGDGGQATMKVGFSVPLLKNLTMKPNINYTVPFGNLSDDSYANQSSRFWGGFSLAYAF